MVAVLVRQHNRVEIVDAQADPPQPEAQLPEVESVVEQHAGDAMAVRRLDHQRVAFAAGAEAAETQHRAVPASATLG